MKEIEDGSKTTNDEKERKKMLRNEILLRKGMCKRDHREQPDLYIVNNMTVAQMKVNLGILLSGDHEQDCDSDVLFPDLETMLSVLDVPLEDATPTAVTNDEDEVLLNVPYTAIWDYASGREWCIGMTRERIGKDEYLIDYLECTPNNKLKV